MSANNAGSRYRAISHADFLRTMSEIGFAETRVPGAAEYAYERMVNNGPHPSERFKVRVFSSVAMDTGWSRECGGDAIRVLLVDTVLKRPVLDWTVHRTENALPNATKRAREAWGYVMRPEHHCPSCGAMMVKREGKRGEFLGCTAYPVCEMTRTISHG